MARPPATGPGTRACARATARPRGARLQPGRGGPPGRAHRHRSPSHRQLRSGSARGDDDDPIFGDSRNGMRPDTAATASIATTPSNAPTTSTMLPAVLPHHGREPACAVNPLAMLDPHTRPVHGVECAPAEHWRLLASAHAVKFAGNFVGPRFATPYRRRGASRSHRHAWKLGLGVGLPAIAGWLCLAKPDAAAAPTAAGAGHPARRLPADRQRTRTELPPGRAAAGRRDRRDVRFQHGRRGDRRALARRLAAPRPGRGQRHDHGRATPAPPRSSSCRGGRRHPRVPLLGRRRRRARGRWHRHARPPGRVLRRRRRRDELRDHATSAPTSAAPTSRAWSRPTASGPTASAGSTPRRSQMSTARGCSPVGGWSSSTRTRASRSATSRCSTGFDLVAPNMPLDTLLAGFLVPDWRHRGQARPGRVRGRRGHRGRPVQLRRRRAAHQPRSTRAPTSSTARARTSGRAVGPRRPPTADGRAALDVGPRPRHRRHHRQAHRRGTTEAMLKASTAGDQYFLSGFITSISRPPARLHDLGQVGRRRERRHARARRRGRVHDRGDEHRQRHRDRRRPHRSCWPASPTCPTRSRSPRARTPAPRPTPRATTRASTT